MPIFLRLISISSLSVALRRSTPSNLIEPVVGSTSRDIQRTRVDLPDPDKPIITKISPCIIWTSTARTAPIIPSAFNVLISGLTLVSKILLALAP